MSHGLFREKKSAIFKTNSPESLGHNWIYLYFFEKFFWTNSRDFFFLGHVAKISFPDLGHVATIHGIIKYDLIKADIIIREFVQELDSLYSPRIMLSGVHELLHLVEMTLDFGPLNGVNCFQFEELNRKMIRFVHGFDLIGEFIIWYLHF